ncbi:MAG: hypothetical protein PWP60_656 [Candidatus Atribacteria bacterium]|jgi:hypothetical protein|uniref:Transposase n=1 Tax=Thermatribacter velox TaxID=3039681 RepID=A0ABZ2YDN7_9BACT|nr:hypothetical protein [Candidatus Atribacteria bacterium]MDI3530807.1 hypothetical protein [Candidatus Atribacteria bacterium]
MEILSNQNITLSQLLAQAQERVKDEVLKFLKYTLEELLETLRSEVVGRGKYEHCASSKLYRYGYRTRKFLETSWGTILWGKDSSGERS